MEFTQYFQATSLPDRATIKIEKIINHPISEQIQEEGRIRRRTLIPEAEGHFLRVVLLEDGKTVHNAFFDKLFKL